MTFRVLLQTCLFALTVALAALVGATGASAQDPADAPVPTPSAIPSAVPAVAVTPSATPTAPPSPTATATPAPTPAPTTAPDSTALEGLLAHPQRAKPKPTASPAPHAPKPPAKLPKPRDHHRRTPKTAPGATPTPTATPGAGAAPVGGPGSDAMLGGAMTAPIGVPNFFIDKFRIPPFLLPIYQAAGIQYGIRWEVLAAINEIETDYGRNLNVSTAGAEGWMQFMPATWKLYGVDANKDGIRDPYNPVDAIFAAARYLRAAGGDKDVARGIFAYNHAGWYVDSVLLRARMIGGLPAGLVGSLTGLTQARFPVQARARYAGAVTRRSLKPTRRGHNAAVPVEGSARRHGIDIYARHGSAVIAVGDGRIVRVGRSRRLGRYVQLQDAYGNVFTYARLGSVAATVPAPRPGRVRRHRARHAAPAPTRAIARPTRPASSTRRRATERRPAAHAAASVPEAAPVLAPTIALTKDRLFANPARAHARVAGGEVQLAEAGYDPQRGDALRLNPRDYKAVPMRKGTRVIGGSILGRVGRGSGPDKAHLRFEIRPVGKGAPRIDPKPILDGWRLLEATAIYRTAGRNPLGGGGRDLSIGQILLMGKQQLQRHLLRNRDIDVYPCGRRDIRLGLIDRRVLATLEVLAASGLHPTVSSMQCGHGTYTTSGNVSEHSSGNAVDIAAVNGTPIVGHQGPGSITETTIRRLLTLQGTMAPHQIISLMTFKDAPNTLSMADHANHIHVGFRPLQEPGSRAARQADGTLKPKQWTKLVDRLSQIDNPIVPTSRTRPLRDRLSPHP